MAAFMKFIFALIAVICCLQLVEMARLRRDEPTADKDTHAPDFTEFANKLMEEFKKTLNNEELQKFLKSAHENIQEVSKSVSELLIYSYKLFFFKFTHQQLDGNCDNASPLICDESHHAHHHNIDLVTALRSELAALSYQKDRLKTELTETKATLCSKDNECENLRAQAARQSTLIASLQSRLQSAENREESVQLRCDTTVQTIQREKRLTDERNKDLQMKIQHLETNLTNESTQKDLVQNRLNDFLKRLGLSLNMEGCESAHLTTECVLTRVEELMADLQRMKAKIAATCETLSSCESELLNLKTVSNIEKQRLMAQLESINNHEHELEVRCRQYERDLQIQRDRFTEVEIGAEKLKEELRGFESRCHRLQGNCERVQNDRLQFLRTLAHQHDKLKETQQNTQCRLRSEEVRKSELEERLEKCHEEIHILRKDHLGLPEYLLRLAKALHWTECSSPPELGIDTNIMAESLLERAERLASLHHDYGHLHTHQHHLHRSGDRSCCDHNHHHAHVHPHTKLRRERSCHDLPVKDTPTSLYNLQRKVRVLKEQIQRRDLHLELLKRKLAIIEDGARGKCILQGERDEAVCRTKKANKIIDKLTCQLVDVRSQVAEVKAQLAEAVEYKITALERARKIDELTKQLCDVEEEKTRLLAQVSNLRERLKASSESAQHRRCRDEALINSLRDDLTHVQAQLSDTNHRLSQLQSFRTSVARTLHLRDLPETDLLHRLQALCSAHQEFTMLSKRYSETASPLGEHACTRFDDRLPQNTHYHPSHCTPPPNSTMLHGHRGFH
uniref:Coiled-coil domain-containing protein 170 n=2 Tax=Glossina brevipalpis TaxID=37001 RepID=A0A1A9WL34_9MUSC